MGDWSAGRGVFRAKLIFYGVNFKNCRGLVFKFAQDGADGDFAGKFNEDVLALSRMDGGDFGSGHGFEAGKAGAELLAGGHDFTVFTGFQASFYFHFVKGCVSALMDVADDANVIMCLG